MGWGGGRRGGGGGGEGGAGATGISNDIMLRSLKELTFSKNVFPQTATEEMKAKTFIADILFLNCSVDFIGNLETEFRE